jgi:hypothetical protein
MHYNAWLATGPDRMQACLVSDISDSGARIELPDDRSLPDRFMLLLSRNGAARRACQVIWRKASHVGVKFIATLGATDHAAPPSDADAAAPKEPASPEPNLSGET